MGVAGLRPMASIFTRKQCLTEPISCHKSGQQGEKRPCCAFRETVFLECTPENLGFWSHCDIHSPPLTAVHAWASTLNHTIQLHFSNTQQAHRHRHTHFTSQRCEICHVLCSAASDLLPSTTNNCLQWPMFWEQAELNKLNKQTYWPAWGDH